MPPVSEPDRPKYLQVANHYRGLILKGELAPGDELPSERQLVDQWRISRPTATRALGVLRVEGLVEARQGSGTYVRAQPQLNRRARDRYARSRETGRIYTPGEVAEIRTAELVPADADVALALDLHEGSPSIRRERLIRDESGPVELSTSWFDGGLQERAPRLLERQRIREGTLAYVERCTRRRASGAHDWVGARLATEREESALELGRPSAVLVVRHLVSDSLGRPLEYTEATYPPERWALEQQYPVPG